MPTRKRKLFGLGRHFRMQPNAEPTTKRTTPKPNQFRGQLCGLCGDCGTDQFRLRNGTKVEVPLNPFGKFDMKAIQPVSLDWMEQSVEFKGQKCGVVDVKDNCTKVQKKNVAHESLCVILKQKDNALQKCFDVI